MTTTKIQKNQFLSNYYLCFDAPCQFSKLLFLLLHITGDLLDFFFNYPVYSIYAPAVRHPDPFSGNGK